MSNKKVTFDPSVHQIAPKKFGIQDCSSNYGNRFCIDAADQENRLRKFSNLAALRSGRSINSHKKLLADIREQNSLLAQSGHPRYKTFSLKDA